MSIGRPAPDNERHFGDLAARYEELRSGPRDEAIEILVREDDLDLRGRCVLDVGCGTGRMAAALAERYARPCPA